MATYQPRKGSNVSQYIANLNTMPSAHDVATQQEEQNFNIDEELAQFTNTDFFDYDPADFLDQSIPDLNPAQGEHARSDNASTNDKIGAKGMHFVTGMPISTDLYPELYPPLKFLLPHFESPMRPILNFA